MNNELSQEMLLQLYEPFGVGEHYFHKYHGFCYLKEEAISRRLTQICGLNWGIKINGFEYYAPGPDMIKAEGDAMVSADLLQSREDSRHARALEHWRNTNGNIQNTALTSDGELLSTPVETAPPDTPRDVRLGKKVIIDLPMGIVWGTFRVMNQERDFLAGDVEAALGKEPNTRKLNTLKAAYTDALKRGSRMFGVGTYLTELSVVPDGGEKVTNHETLRAWPQNRYPNDMRFMKESEAKALVMRTLHEETGIQIDKAWVIEALTRIGNGPFKMDNIYSHMQDLRSYAAKWLVEPAVA